MQFIYSVSLAKLIQSSFRNLARWRRMKTRRSCRTLAFNVRLGIVAVVGARCRRCRLITCFSASSIFCENIQFHWN